jgi:hypothetical protein
VVVAVIAVWVMQVSVYKVVDVVTVRYSFVTAVRAMRVRALGSRSVLRWIRGIDRQDMLVNMIPMHVVQMAVMNIVDVTIMADRSVAAGRSVLVGMVGMVFFVASSHRLLSLIVLLGSGRLGLIFSAVCPNFALILPLEAHCQAPSSGFATSRRGYPPSRSKTKARPGRYIQGRWKRAGTGCRGPGL